MKACRKCGVDQLEGQYPMNRRRYDLQHRFGVTPDEVDQAFASQGGLCGNPRCGRPATVIDHNHVTGKFRKWLCHGCNAALGLLAESEERIQGLRDYLLCERCIQREWQKIQALREELESDE